MSENFDLLVAERKRHWITKGSKLHPLGTMHCPYKNFMAIRPIAVELLQSGQKWWTDRLTDMLVRKKSYLSRKHAKHLMISDSDILRFTAFLFHITVN